MTCNKIKHLKSLDQVLTVQLLKSTTFYFKVLHVVCKHWLTLILYYCEIFQMVGGGGVCGTVVARWTTGPQVERAILHQGHDS